MVSHLPPEAAVQSRLADGDWWTREDEMRAAQLEIAHSAMRAAWGQVSNTRIPPLLVPRPAGLIVAPAQPARRDDKVVTAVAGPGLRQAFDGLRAS